MSAASFYRQCTLEISLPGGGTHRLVTWIPEKQDGVTVEPGVSLRIKAHGAADFEQGHWTVTHVGDERRPVAEVRERAHSWTKHRKASDI